MTRKITEKEREYIRNEKARLLNRNRLSPRLRTSKRKLYSMWDYLFCQLCKKITRSIKKQGFCNCVLKKEKRKINGKIYRVTIFDSNFRPSDLKKTYKIRVKKARSAIEKANPGYEYHWNINKVK